MKLIVIDIQKEITKDRLYNYPVFLESVKKVIAAAREKGLEVIYVRHDDGEGKALSKGQPGFEIFPEVAPVGDEKIFDKNINSAFGSAEFTAYLEEAGDKDLMIVGLLANFCVDCTIRSAFERGYKVTVPAECNSTFGNKYMDAETTWRYLNEMMWPDRFAKCVGTEEALEIIGNA